MIENSALPAKILERRYKRCNRLSGESIGRKKEAFNRLRKTIVNKFPDGYQENIGYGMIGYVVPHRLYPELYHCNPALPLPFVSIASQKNFFGLYHTGI